MDADAKTRNEIKRTILYYPTISVPNGDWLRQALLFWDEVSSIVPESWDGIPLIPYTPEIEYLKREGQFRPIHPESLLGQTDGWKQKEELHAEVESIVRRPSYIKGLGHKKKWRLEAPIHPNKVSDGVFDILRKKGLAKESNSRWLLFENKTGLLYMAILAKYLADTDTQQTITGTDRMEYERLIYDPSGGEGEFSCLDIRFRKSLPIPRDDIPLSDIIDFKIKRRTDLLHFRKELNDFHEKLSETERLSDVKQVIADFKEKIERELNNLAALLHDSNIAAIAGSLKTIISLKSPTLWASAGVVSGKAAKIADLPIDWILPGIGILGLIEISHHFIDSRNKKRVTLRESPFAYLYHAREEGLV